MGKRKRSGIVQLRRPTDQYSQKTGYRGLTSRELRLQGGACVHQKLPDAQAFWEEHIARRAPALIRCHINDEAWLAGSRWTNSYLKETAGHCWVAVEHRQQAWDGYGQGRKVPMTFGEFLEKMAAGDDLHYLSTQEMQEQAPSPAVLLCCQWSPVAQLAERVAASQAAVGFDRAGHPNLLAAPLTELQADIPLRPALMGNLVPQQINLWMGAAQEGSSSGLHHDFHDNLYILLRGRKRFRLWSPDQASQLYTHGCLERVHPNGRIIYHGQGDILADGSHASDAKRWAAQAEGETELAAAEAAVRSGHQGSDAQLRQAEAKLDAALNAALGDDFDPDHFDLADDFDAADSEDEGVPALRQGNSSGQGAAAAGEEDPASFSRIDLSQPEAKIRAAFPLFPGRDSALEVELQAGEMLYLPAGWFHEVTSFSDGRSQGHMAMNYWFHPPDNLECSQGGFAHPYRSGYWSALWRGRPSQEEQNQFTSPAQKATVLQGGQLSAEHIDDPGRRWSHRVRPPPVFGIGRRQHLNWMLL